MKVFMVIVFILSNGKELVHNQGGWAPQEVTSMEECIRKKEAAIEYIEWAMETNRLPEYYAGYKVVCKEVEK